MQTTFRITFGLLLCSLFSVAFAQQDNLQTFIRRIPFSEKQNATFRDLPLFLLQAHCEGKIQGYFPSQPDQSCSYADFAHYFGFPLLSQMQMDNSYQAAQTPSVQPCAEAACPEIDPLSLRCFQSYLDLYEEQYLDRRTGRYTYKTVWVRLVYSHTCTENGLEYYGTLFKYEDIARLDQRYAISLSQNRAAQLTIAQIFSERLFSGFIIEHNGESIENPAQYTAEQEKKTIYKEVHYYED
jgi:hypothetical protein